MDEPKNTSASQNQEPSTSTTQPEPVVAQPDTIQPQKPRFSKKLIILVVAIILLLGGGAYAFYRSQHNSTKTSTTTPPAKQEQVTTKPVPPVTYGSVLVFQPSSSASTSTTSLVGLDGTVKSTFSSNASSSSYDASGFSQENLELLEGSALITVDKNWSSFAILTPDGKATPTSASLATLLAGNAHPNSANSLSSGITTGNSTLFALESSSGASTVKLVKIDLLGGTNSTLLTADPIKQEGAGYTPLQLVTLSRDGKTAYLIANDVKLGSSTSTGVSLVVLDTTTNKFSLKTLPDGADPSSTSVSKDGKFVAYITFGSNNGYASATTHIYNVATGKDSAVTEEGLSTSSGANDIRFSPDGAYVSVVGNYAADAKKAGMALQIISTSSNSVTHQVDLVGVQNQVTGFDWTSDNKMVYATNSSSTGNYDVMKEAVHTIEASSGKVFDFPKNSGELVAVLNYQQ